MNTWRKALHFFDDWTNVPEDFYPGKKRAASTPKRGKSKKPKTSPNGVVLVGKIDK